MPNPARIVALLLLAMTFLAAVGTGLWFLGQGISLVLLDWWGSPLWAALGTGGLFLAPLLIMLIALLTKKKPESPKDVLIAAALKEAVKHPVAAAAVTLGLGYLAGRSPLAESLLARILRENAKQ